MEIKSFGGFVKAVDVPRNRVTNSASQAFAIQISEKLKACKPGEAMPIEVTNFGRFERYALQQRLQKRGEKVQLTITGARDKEGNIKTGTLYVIKMTDEQWKHYTTKPGSTATKK